MFQSASSRAIMVAAFSVAAFSGPGAVPAAAQGGQAGVPPPVPRNAPVESCTVGVNCCYIGMRHNPDAYSMAWDQTVGGMVVLGMSGFGDRVHGPTSGANCLAYWAQYIAPLPGYSPWRVGAASAMTDGAPQPQPVAGAAQGGANPPPPARPDDGANAPPPATGHWRFVAAQALKHRRPSDARTMTNETSVQDGAMSATFTENMINDEGPATWGGKANWTWSAPSGVSVLVPGEKIQAQLAVSDHSVPEKKSGWRHGATGVSCAIRFDNPAHGVGASDQRATDIVNVAVGEQKSATRSGAAAIPNAGWEGRLALVASCAQIGKFQRVYQWVPPGAAAPTGAAPAGDAPANAAAASQGGGAQPWPTTSGSPVLPPAAGDATPAAPAVDAGQAAPGRAATSGAIAQGAPDAPPRDERPPPIRRVTKLFDNWNSAACAFTDRADFALEAPAQITHVELWYNWRAGERTLPFVLADAGGALAEGELTRGACDPNQASWCVATASLAVAAQPGAHVVQVGQARLCQNAQSGGRGFVRVRGMR